MAEKEISSSGSQTQCLSFVVASFAYLLKKVDFNAIIDHLALTHITKSTADPATNK